MRSLCSLVAALALTLTPGCGGDGDGDESASSSSTESSGESGGETTGDGDGDGGCGPESTLCPDGTCQGDESPFVCCMHGGECGDGDGDGDGDGATGDGDGTCSDTCPTPAASPPATETVVIEWLDLATDTLSLVNTGSSDVDSSAWQACAGPGRYVAVSAATLAAGASTTIDVSGLALDTTDSVGIYSDPDFSNSAAMRAFVQWGTSGSAREPVAVAAGLWTAGTFADVCSTHELLVATGDATMADLWESANASCAP